MSSLPTQVRYIITNKQRKVFLVGAGISKDPPTSFPIASELISALMECISRIVPTTLNEYVQLVEQGIINGTLGYRLEVLLEIARQGMGDRVLKLLNFFEHSVPNINHYLMALYLSKGHIVITTNFDTMIEDAYVRLIGNAKNLTVIVTEKEFEVASVSLPSGGSILIKLHGSVHNIRKKPNYKSIQITLASIANGLSRGKRRLLNKLLHDHNFIVLGYSGNDDFDINPLLLASKTKRRFLWIKHRDIPLTVWGHNNLPESLPKDDTIRLFLTEKTNSFLIEGVTREFLSLLPDFKTASDAVSLASIPSVSWKEILEKSVISDLAISKISCIRYMAKILEYNSKLDIARACFEEGLKYAHGIERAELLDDIGQCCLLSRDMAASMSYRLIARKVAHRFDSETAKLIVARSWLGIGECLRHMTNYSLALRAFRKAVIKFESLRMHDRVAYCLSGIGGIFRMTSRFNAAENEYRRALVKFHSGRDLLGRIYALWGLAEIFKYRGDFRNSHKYCIKVRSQAIKLGHDRLIALIIWQEAELLRMQFHISEALNMYTEALERFPTTDIAGRSWAFEGMAQCKILIGQSPLSEINSAMVGFESLHAMIGLASVKLDEAIFFLNQRDPTRAWKILQNVKINSLPPKDIANYHLLLASYQASIGDEQSIKTYRGVALAYRRLGMDFAFVAAVILMAESLPLKNVIRSKLWGAAKAVSKKNNYIHECIVIRDIEASRNPMYLINLF